MIDANPFCTYGSSIRELNDALWSKSTKRTIQEDGPIDQPPYFIIRKDMLLRTAINGKEVRDFSYDPNYVNHAKVIPFAAGLGHFFENKISFLIKPNQSAFGEGIVDIRFIDDYAHLTMIYPTNRCEQSCLILDYLERFGIYPSISTDQNIFQAKVAEQDFYPIMTGIWQELSSIENRCEVIYDSGMFEERVQTLKINENAYETRHFFRYDAQNDLLIARTNDSYCRVGSSGLFSNVTGRPKADCIMGENMYDPVENVFGLNHKKLMQDTADELIPNEVRYVCKRLTNAGAKFTSVSGCIDLMWRQDKSGLRPVIIESEYELHNY